MERGNTPRVLVCLQYYLPGYKSGGPIHSLEGLVAQLGTEFDFHILAYDRDSGDASPYAEVEVEAVQKFGHGRVQYIPKTGRRWKAMLAALRGLEWDLLYLQSLTNPCFTIWPLLLRKFGLIMRTPVLLAPRGELSAGALAVRARKKRIFLMAARWLGLYAGVNWHATSHAEAEEIRGARLSTSGRGSNEPGIFLAQNLRVLSSAPMAARQVPNGGAEDRALKLVFLSRIAPKKNLDGALRILGRVRCPVEFGIYGPVDRTPDYWDACQPLIQALPEHIQAVYHGSVRPEEVASMFAAHDLFLFPTHGENFGHVIIESLLAGCPVLISDCTPWRGLRECDAGWDLPLNEPERFVEAIEDYAKATAERRVAMRAGALAFGRRALNLEGSIEAHRQMFRAVIPSAAREG